MSSNASDSIAGKYHRFGKLKVEKRSSRRAENEIAPNDAVDPLIPRTQEALYGQKGGGRDGAYQKDEKEERS